MSYSDIFILVDKQRSPLEVDVPAYSFLSCVIPHGELEESQTLYCKEPACWRRSRVVGRETGENKSTEWGCGEIGGKTLEGRNV